MAFRPVNKGTTAGYPYTFSGFLVDALQFFNLLNGGETADYTTKDGVLTVHKGKRCASRNVPLAFISMFHACALAHTQLTNFWMFHVEGFVFELWAKDRWLAMFDALDFAALHKHTRTNTMNLSVFITNGGTLFMCVGVVNGTGELQKVGNSLRTDVFKQLKDNRKQILTTAIEMNLDVSSAMRSINLVSNWIHSQILVVLHITSVLVMEVDQSPFSKSIAATNVLRIVQVNNWWATMVKEVSFLHICKLL